MTHRSRILHRIAREAAQDSGAIYVNGFKEKDCDPFVLEADKFNARDGLHPSDEGYKLWFQALDEQASLTRRLKENPRTAIAPPVQKPIEGEPYRSAPDNDLYAA